MLRIFFCPSYYFFFVCFVNFMVKKVLFQYISGYPVNFATMFCGNPPRLALLATPPGRDFVIAHSKSERVIPLPGGVRGGLKHVFTKF